MPSLCKKIAGSTGEDDLLQVIAALTGKGKETLRMLKDEKFDLVITDFNIPGMK